MRVYEIAREVGLPNKELIAKIKAMGLEVNNHMSSLDPDDVARVKRSLEKEKQGEKTTAAPVKKTAPTVLRRRGKVEAKDEDEAGAPAESREATYSVPSTPSPATVVVRRRAVEPTAPSEEPKRNGAPVNTATTTSRQPVQHVEAEEPTSPAAEAYEAAFEPSFEPSSDHSADESAADEQVEEPSSPAAEVSANGANGEASNAKAYPAVIQVPRIIDISGRRGATSTSHDRLPHPVSSQPPIAVTVRTPDIRQTEARVVRPAEGRVAREGGKTVDDVAGGARSRFEAELERARRASLEREQMRARKTDAPSPGVEMRSGDAAARPAVREDGRPEVGSIINLPVPRIKITERGPAGRPLANTTMPGQSPANLRGRFAQQQNQHQKPSGRNKMDMRNKPKKGMGKQTQITTPAEHKRVIRIEDTIAIPELAKQMGIKAAEVLKKLWTMGMTGVNINASIDFDTAQLLSGEFGYEVQNVAFKEEAIFESRPDAEGELQNRAPVVTVMGHVDHGKTSLLDYIRKARVAAGESGGITQHIGAYRVKSAAGTIVFIDTPGHAAFTEMRARGAQCTDVVILVCAADDGIMPQTIEALAHAKDAKVPVIVAVNKCDLPQAQPDRVRQQLSDHGLIPEEWGGETMYVNVSALKGDGMDRLLEAVALQAEMLDLKANPAKPAMGTVIESKLDRARGPMATVLIQEGTLRVGDIVVVGEHLGKIRAMLDDSGASVAEAGPSTPVELLGLDGVPEAGDTINATNDERMAKQVVEHRYQAKRRKELATTSKISLENLMERIQEGVAKELKVVLKADVHGSSEALKDALTKLSTDKVTVSVISSGVGGITETDVNLAKAGGAVIVGFHVRPAGKASKVAEQEGVEIKLYDIIYEALDDVKAAMAGLLAPIRREKETGRLEVRDTFNIPKRGVVAGCMVTQGRILRKSLLRIIRDSVQVYEGRVSSLRRFKDEAGEVKEGFECGLIVDGFQDIKVGDIVETYEIVEEAATL